MSRSTDLEMIRPKNTEFKKVEEEETYTTWKLHGS